MVFGIREAAWPAIRGDLGLNYAAVGVLLTIPNVVAAMVEPVLGLLGNSGKRRTIILAGGVAFAVALVLSASATTFAVLLLAFCLLYPASGAFVSLSEASLMDLDPTRHEENMARWVLAGSVGIVVGPLALTAATRVGWGWRTLFLVLALAMIPLIVRSGRSISHAVESAGTVRDSARTAWRALRDREVLRWMLMLELTDLLGDVLTGFLAIYFVDVVHVSVVDAAFAIVVWSVAGLIGDGLLVPLLDLISGTAYLRISAAFALVIYPGLLIAPGLIPKLVFLSLLGLIHAGWYAIPQGRLYTVLSGNSGVALTVSNIAGLPAYAFPLVIGLLAQRFGLGAALWCCVIAPIGLLAGLPWTEGWAPRDDQAA